MGRLDGKIAVITGARRGIGRGIAICLAEEGADIVIGDLVCDEETEAVVRTITQLGRTAMARRVDVSDPDRVSAWIIEAVGHFGKLDIAVANAGCSVRQLAVEADWKDVQRVIGVTQLGVFHTCQSAAKQMMVQDAGGKIIVIGSILAEFPFAASGAYNMAKAGINQLAATMANELARYHINVNVINPGWIDTPGEREFATEEQLQQGAKRIPWGRLGTARDIGRCAVFLASEDADYITGASLRVDGGFMVGLKLPEAPAES